MKRFCFLISLWILGANFSAQAGTPQFIKGSFIKSTPLLVGERDESYSSPCVVDWDNDSKKDLIIGDASGYIWFYKNQGSNSQPIFTTATKLQSSQGDIYVTAGYAVAFVIDWDKQNNLDLVVGDGQGNLSLYMSTNNRALNTLPLLGTSSPILASGSPINVGRRAAPFVCDWNNDSVKDLVVGNNNGEVLIFLGAGNDSNPSFGNYSALQFGSGTTLRLGYPVTPCVTFWDGEGVKDIILGDEEGYLRLYLNIPTLATSTFICNPKNYSLIKANRADLDAGYDAKPVVVDWDSDNKKDLIVGDRYGQISLFCNLGQDYAPVFNSPFQIHLNGQHELKIGQEADPFVCDWNNDHINDLMLGDELGRLRICLGNQENTSLQFAASSQIQQVIGTHTPTVSSLAVAGHASPRVLDWNSDGKKDLLVGSTDGQLYLFLNTGTDEQPTFGTSPTTLFIGTSSTSLDFGEEARLYIVDWNKDGLFDIVVGNKKGEVYKSLNSGLNKPVWTEKSLVLTINSGYACPSLMDIDGDEKRDLIIGSGNGYIYFYKNLGKDNDPRFDEATPIKVMADNQPLHINGRAIPYVGDWNGDGINDLMVGIGSDSDIPPAGYVEFFPGLTTNTPPKVTLTPPSGTQTEMVTLVYTLIDDESNTCNIQVQYSLDQGQNWATATPSFQTGDDLSNLSSSPDGTKHIFVWNSAKDIPGTISYVYLRIIPRDELINGYPSKNVEIAIDNLNLPLNQMIRLGGEEILDVGAYSKPYIVNWDDENGPDLLIGNEFGNVYLAVNAAPWNTEPVFYNVYKLQHQTGSGSATQAIDVGAMASPMVIDWDMDGDKDLLVGNGNGDVYLFRNSPNGLGPKERINLGTRTFNQAAIFGIEGNWSQSSQTKNLLIGDEQGLVNLFLNKGTKTDAPSFSSSVQLHTNPLIDVGYNAVPFWADWNGNGKKDLVVGARDGFVYLFVNYGTDTPLFFKPSKITLDGKPIQARLGFSAPVVYDWDFDGQDDLLMGTKEGYLLFFKAGQRTNNPPEVEITPLTGTQSGLITLNYRLKDADGNEVDIQPEFFLNGQWRSATLTYSSGTNTVSGLLANADGLAYTFIWDSLKDLPATQSQVMFRILPQDRVKGVLDKYGSSIVVSLFIDNWNVSPVISEINVSGSSTDIVISYNLLDPDDEFATVTIEYQGGKKGTSTWFKPTLASQTTRVAPGSHSLIWLSAVDEAGTSASNYRFRIIPYDQMGTGTRATSTTFSINNISISSLILSGTASLSELSFPGVKVEIKEFHLKTSPRDDVIVSVKRVNSSDVPPLKTLSALDNTIYEFKVTKKAAPSQEVEIDRAVITIPYDDLGSFETESRLRIYKLEQGKWQMIGGTPVMNKNEVWVEVKGFSIYRLGLDVQDISEFRIWPNPFKPTDGIKENGEFGAGGDYEFIIFSGVAKVEIYTLSTELVRLSAESELDSTGTWKWNAKNYDGQLVSTGVYIYLITDRSGQTKTGKIAVIR